MDERELDILFKLKKKKKKFTHKDEGKTYLKKVMDARTFKFFH